MCPNYYFMAIEATKSRQAWQAFLFRSICSRIHIVLNKWGDENSRTKITPIRKTLYLFSRFLRTLGVNSIDIKNIRPIFGQKLRLISVLYFQFTSRANFRADFRAQIYVNWFDPQGLVQNMSEQACMKQSTVSFTHSLAIVLHWGTVIQWPFSARNRLIHLLSRVQWA